MHGGSRPGTGPPGLSGMQQPQFQGAVAVESVYVVSFGIAGTTFSLPYIN